MHERMNRESLKSGLFLPWVITAIMFSMLAAYFIICQILGDSLRQPLPEAQRVLIRTLFYVIAIVTFPMTNLIRHIQLRLNQTMPGDKSAKNRYLLTIIISMSFIESIGILGFVMFILGDDFNTLYIFTLMSALGFFLYRPKPEEYIRIKEALGGQHE
jgi:hypothetical protein